MTVYAQPDFSATDVDPAELDRIETWMREAAKRSMSPKERRAQQVSWIIGMMPSGSTMTREEIEEMLNEKYGRL